MPTNTLYYQLPEVDKRFEEIKKEEKKFDQLWNGFRKHVESESTFESAPVIARFDEIKESAQKLKSKASKLGPNSMSKELQAKLKKRNNFIRDFEELRMNGFLDVDNINESDFNEEPTEELNMMKRDKMFWRNFGRKYNQAFDRNMNWEIKVKEMKEKMKYERERVNNP